MKAITSTTFFTIGNKYTKTKAKESKTIRLRRFKSFFGITPDVCFLVWEKIKMDAPVNAEPKHLLWCLIFLKRYTIEHIRKAMVKADEKTIRKWAWIFVKLLSNLQVIIWENRLDSADPGQTCFVSIDGVDFKILEPTPIDRRWFSHKLRGPGLRYEIGLNIRNGHMVWVHGGYPCGEYSDLKLARECFVLSLNDGERSMADKDYLDDQFFIQPNDINCKQHKLIMSRHEIVNRRIRKFEILKKKFRHDREKHPMVFYAIANLTQLMIENGEPLFKVI